MKSTLNEVPANKAPAFPYMGKSKTTSLVVLFTGGSGVLIGTVIRGDAHWKVDDHSFHFATSCFEPLPPGSQITLEQE